MQKFTRRINMVRETLGLVLEIFGGSAKVQTTNMIFLFMGLRTKTC